MTTPVLALAAISSRLSSGPLEDRWQNSGEMVAVMQRYVADESLLERKYPFTESPARADRMVTFRKEYSELLGAVDFARLPAGGKADWVLLKNRLDHGAATDSLDAAKLEETKRLVPFLQVFVRFQEQRAGHDIPVAEQAGKDLSDLSRLIAETTAELQKKQKDQTEGVSEPTANRALALLASCERIMSDWHEHFSGYDPMFTWWTQRPFQDANKALNAYQAFVKSQFTKPDDREGGRIVGDRIGREGLMADLKNEMVAYTPEELIDIAKREMEWCNKEGLKAAKDMGCKTWAEALEKVKGMHEEPGNQVSLIVDLAEEAVSYLESNALVTIPALAKEGWRIDMMSPQRQLVSPFFLGGETIIVSFPTDAMTHDQKLMSMRGNNRYFSKATVHHELIPGHHLQGFMQSRYNTHRRGVTGTPFWVEGWALYWEFLLYKRGFAATPEEKIGFLFWRKHRCARIIFSLSFHLGLMSPDECVEMLVDDVGHERSTAEGEVRRSFGGTYPPLYQAAYMLGALQMWQIRRELVDTGKMPEKDFHDAVLQIGSMPWTVVRAILSGQPVTKTFKNDWRFYNGPAE